MMKIVHHRIHLHRRFLYLLNGECGLVAHCAGELVGTRFTRVQSGWTATIDYVGAFDPPGGHHLNLEARRSCRTRSQGNMSVIRMAGGVRNQQPG
ncbi:MAG: hypothetical protein QF565_16770 [Arenicellales bacterium]|nr:hypothetical protein [Arenicellales bacterium]